MDVAQNDMDWVVLVVRNDWRPNLAAITELEAMER